MGSLIELRGQFRAAHPDLGKSPDVSREWRQICREVTEVWGELAANAGALPLLTDDEIQAAYRDAARECPDVVSAALDDLVAGVPVAATG